MSASSCQEAFIPSPNPSGDTIGWEEEEILPSGDALAHSLENLIQTAETSLDLITYIYADDTFGQRIETLLAAAAKRGVKIRLSVDGLGSRAWIRTLGRRLLDQEGITVKVYHPLLWESWLFKSSMLESSTRSINFFTALNHRDHRKLCICDGRHAWVSSMNICNTGLTSPQNPHPWHELGIRVQGDDVKILCAAFDLSWNSFRFWNRERYARKLHLLNASRESHVRLNSTRALRKYSARSLVEKLHTSANKIYIVTPYFVPTRHLMAALRLAAQRGVDVRIANSEKSDVFFMPWVAALYQRKLVRLGIRMFSYKPSFLHTKFLIIDDYAIIGSSNMNRRSLHLDLEIDIVTECPHSVKALLTTFQDIIQQSTPLHEQDFHSQPYWQKMLARCALFFKNSL